MKVPKEAMHSFAGLERLEWADPITWDPQPGYIRLHWNIVARILPNDSAALVLDLQRDRRRRIVGQKIIDHGTVRRILTRGLVWWKRRVRIQAPADSQRGLRFEQNGVVVLVGPLAQRRHVIQDPETAPMSRHRKIVIFDNEIAHR